MFPLLGYKLNQGRTIIGFRWHHKPTLWFPFALTMARGYLTSSQIVSLFVETICELPLELPMEEEVPQITYKYYYATSSKYPDMDITICWAQIEEDFSIGVSIVGSGCDPIDKARERADQALLRKVDIYQLDKTTDKKLISALTNSGFGWISSLGMYNVARFLPRLKALTFV
jgi:hypothetical protein